MKKPKPSDRQSIFWSQYMNNPVQIVDDSNPPKCSKKRLLQLSQNLEEFPRREMTEKKMLEWFNETYERSKQVHEQDTYKRWKNDNMANQIRQLIKQKNKNEKKD